MRRSRSILKLVAGLALLPLGTALLASLLAGVLGCEVNEGGATPCFVLGGDIGGLLSGMLTLGWMAFLTIPFLMLAVGAWAVIEWYVWSRQRRRHRRAMRDGRV